MEEEINISEEDINLSYRKKRRILLFTLAFSIVIVLVLTFWLGGFYTCSNSGGEYLGGFTCIEMEHLGVCERNGRLYKVPDTEIKGTVSFTNS